MVRFECGSLLSEWSAEVSLCSSADVCCDASDALRVLCSSVYRCDCSSASIGVPAVLHALAVCPLKAVCESYRRPSFARLSHTTDSAPPLAPLLSCVLRADSALLLSSAESESRYFLCYVHDAAVCLEEIGVDAVRQSERPIDTEPPQNKGTDSHTANLLLSASSTSASSSRPSRHRRYEAEPAARPNAVTGVGRQRRGKQSTGLLQAMTQKAERRR